MERIQFIEHKGKQILHLDFANAKPGEVVKSSRAAMSVIAKHPPKSLRTLTDVTDMKFDAESTQVLKELASHNAPYVVAGAVVGITGLKQIIYNAVIKFSGRNLVVFDNTDQAKEWLATQ
jgi:hypothetical protein